MEGVAEGLLDAFGGVQPVGDEELHAPAPGADEGQVGAEHAIGKQAVAPFLRLGGGGEVVDVDDKESGGQRQAQLLAVGEYACRRDVGQHGLLLFAEQLLVGTGSAHIAGQLLQVFVGSDVGMKPDQVAHPRRNLVADGGVEKTHDTFIHCCVMFVCNKTLAQMYTQIPMQGSPLKSIYILLNVR